MFRYKNTHDQLIEERRKTAQLRSALDKTSADVEYIAMMADIELDEDSGETEDEDDGAE